MLENWDISDILTDSEQGAPEVVAGKPTFDLNQYINEYQGIIKVLRLEYIARSCSPLAEQALELAIENIKKESLDIERYKTLCSQLLQVNPSNSNGRVDNTWVESTQEKTFELTQKMNAEANYTGSNTTYLEKQAELYFSKTSFVEAHRVWQKQIDILGGDVSLCAPIKAKMAKASLFHGPNSYIRATFNRASIASLTEEDPVYKVLQGLIFALGEVASHQYETACGSLLNLPSSHDQLYQLNDVATTTDIGIYLALSALATISRQELEYLATKDVVFSICCEKAGYLRDLVLAFVRVDYDKFFKILYEHVNDFKCDKFIGPCIDRLMKRIKTRAMRQYLDVYCTVDITKVSELFGIVSNETISIVKDLIAKDKLDARIDIMKNIICTNNSTATKQVFTKSVQVAKEFCHDSRLLLWSVEACQSNNNNTKPTSSSSTTASTSFSSAAPAAAVEH